MSDLQVLQVSVIVYLVSGLLFDLMTAPDVSLSVSVKNELKRIAGNTLLWPFHVLFGIIAFGEVILTFVFAQALKRVKL